MIYLAALIIVSVFVIIPIIRTLFPIAVVLSLPIIAVVEAIKNPMSAEEFEAFKKQKAEYQAKKLKA